MTNGLNNESVKILTWVVYALILILTGATSYLMVAQAQMSDKYVRLERYQSDTQRIESSACRLESKFDIFSDRLEGKIDRLMLLEREP